jgi:RES domain-containing protein
VPPTPTEVYPPLALDEITAQVRSFPTWSTSEKQAFIKRLVACHPIMSFNWGGGWRYRRVRVLDSEADIPATVDELIWRKEVPAALGRANPAEFQVLYLADRVETAFAEKGVNDSCVVLAEFSILPGRSSQIAFVGEMAQIQRTGRGFMAGDASSKLNEILNACARDAATALLIADAFLLNCLTNREDDYEVSSAVALSVFEKLGGFVSALAFPSRQREGGINLAVRVENFWDVWGVFSVRLGHASALAEEFYRFTNIRVVTGITRLGSLRWDEQLSADHTYAPLDPLWTPTS